MGHRIGRKAHGRAFEPRCLQMQHLTTIVRVILNRQKAGSVRPVLENPALGKQFIEPVRRVVSQSAPKHKVGAAGNDMNGVNLQHVHAADAAKYIIFRCDFGWRFKQTHRRELQAARLLQCEPGFVTCACRLYCHDRLRVTASRSASYNRSSVHILPMRYVHQVRPLDSPHGARDKDDRALRSRSGAFC